MATVASFPDQGHLDLIRQRLWSVREFGRAAVMVGAGFSRQALAASPGVGRLPLWDDIGQALASSLYGADGPEFARSMSGPRLASEYERTFSRQALVSYLLELIPHESYVPAHHHTLLLSLPWADVFSTNYDTLLERTLPSVHGRKYEVVTNADDLPERARPRIVKLHGSFPSQHPFTITEDDYRLYPSRLAPFVNTVQQSLMENVFCLLGFSGEDPNFLYWSGWVRDNLGESTPTIYLCGLLDLPAPRRRLLEHRRIIPVDFSPLFPRTNFPVPQERQAAALEWFLLSLHAGEPPNLLDWPLISPRRRWIPTRTLPDIPTPEPLPADATFPASGNLSPTALQDLSFRWGKIRERYPGWEVVPAANGGRLWLNTERYIDQVLEGLPTLPPSDALRLAFELVWRLETALVPLFVNWIATLTPVIEAINPDPTRIDLPAATLRPDDIASSTLEWTALRRIWVELSFAMAKDARDDQDSGRFTLWMTRLQEVAKLQKDWHARWTQEQCLYALGRLDYAAVRSHLASWPTDTLSAFWGTKKAAILAEIGGVPAATATAEAALSAIRGRQQTVPGDIGLLSQEGWTMLLLRQLTLDARFAEPRDDPAEDRRDQLGAYRCNPSPEIQIRAGDVMRRRDAKQRRTTRRQFDPGRWTTSILFSRDEWDSVHTAFVFLRMLEYGALPIRCGQTLIFPEPVTAAVDAIWSAAAAPLLALSTRLRVGTSQDIERTFDRSAIARLSDDQITFLLELTTTAIRQAIQRMHSGEEGSPLQNSNLITVSTEMLSRLAVCLSDDRLEELLQLAITLYRDPFLRGIGFQRSLGNLFRRIISALPQERLGMRAHDLAELPIPGVGGFEVQDPEGWTEPFAGWPWHKIPVGGERQTWARTIDWLTSVAATAAAGPRGNALIRLHRLYRLDILTAPQTQGFGEALWARLEDGLPSETLFRPSAFVVLPHPENQRPLAALHAYFLQRDFRRLVGESPGTFSFPASEDMYLHALVDVTLTQWRGDEPHHYIDWSRAEALTILEKWKGWWTAHKPALAGRDISDVPATVRKEVQQMLEVLSLVVFPRIGDATPAEKSQALALLRDVDAAGASSTPAIPSAIYVGMEPLAAARRLRTGLLNASRPTVVDAIRGIQYWVYNLSPRGLPPPQAALIDDLVRLVTLRRSPALVSALTVLSDVVKKAPYLLTDDHWQIISTALNFLERETSLQAPDIGAFMEEVVTIELEERPACRLASASLAHAISTMDRQPSQEGLREVVEHWRVAVSVDRLPEVRKVWSN